MINLIMTLSLFNVQPALQTAQFKPCVWPNICLEQPVQTLAQFKPCVWPNICVSTPASTL
ncbi:MAG: hypothetical protein AAB036_01875 [Elusimicrobiota bacterium]